MDCKPIYRAATYSYIVMSERLFAVLSSIFNYLLSVVQDGFKLA